MIQRSSSAVAVLVLAIGVGGVTATAATSGAAPRAAASQLRPLDDFSPTILGIYRKVMEIEDEIRRHTDRYGVDYELARAVCMYESGGNANLTSWAGARGYFQVMPATFRGLRVDTNIEAGIKYLSQLVERFEREDYALAAYNGGPGNVGRGRAMRLESLQYVLGVGYYRTMLKMHEASIREHASRLRLTTVRDDEDWWTLARRLDMPLMQLRMHNPYLARRTLRPGQLVAYPETPRPDLIRIAGDTAEYTSRLGDNYFNIAFTLDVDLDRLRQENGLWHLQTLPTGLRLRIPLDWEGEHAVYRVQSGDTLESIAGELESQPWRIIRDNALFNSESLTDGMVLRVRKEPPPPQYVTHRVQRGENLSAIASRYGTTVSTIQEANGMGRRTMIQIGEQLRIPRRAE